MGSQESENRLEYKTSVGGRLIMAELTKDQIRKLLGRSLTKDDKTPTPRAPRISITQVELNALITIIESHKSNWHYRECKFWKHCQRVHRGNQNNCHCNDYKQFYPNTDIVIDNVSSLLKKLEKVIK